jgi:hypothetical protein
MVGTSVGSTEEEVQEWGRGLWLLMDEDSRDGHVRSDKAILEPRLADWPTVLGWKSAI